MYCNICEYSWLFFCVFYLLCAICMFSSPSSEKRKKEKTKKKEKENKKEKISKEKKLAKLVITRAKLPLLL